MARQHRDKAAKQAEQNRRPGQAHRPRGRGGVLALFLAAFLLVGVLFTTGVILNRRILSARSEALRNLQPVQQTATPVLSEGLPIVELIEQTAPSVVSVEVFAGGGSRATANGSGVILSEDGHMVTNAHVVEGEALIRVTLHDGGRYTAEIVGMNKDIDLAVLYIPAHGLQPAVFGNSDDIRLGEQVIAIGNAAGILPGSPTLGIISGLDREVPIQTMDGTVTNQNLLQTDAAINPGNSGGALLNMHGQVIGINVSKLQTADIDNIGFAIPSNVAVPAINAILEEAALHQR